eukprot:TRINITY_DN16533_c0_g1_i1.p2 TRINITY_DN16533_c0_g1~~TRINITY_DN16533_c0_g1_i1.p2  ORF type:complete len:100 (+),score=7.07 TRINITY_DN16533_c0_g1_i1:385-684(+)
MFHQPNHLVNQDTREEKKMDIEDLGEWKVKSCMCKTCGLATEIPPDVPLYGAYTVHLEQGKKYLWCTCGLGKQQPWCDLQSCLNTSFRPIEFTPKKHTK